MKNKIGVQVLLPEVNSTWGVIVHPQSANAYRHIINFKTETDKLSFLAKELFPSSPGYDIMNELDKQPNQSIIYKTAARAEIIINPDDYPTMTLHELLSKDFCIVKIDNELKYYTLSGEMKGLQIKYSAELDVFMTYDIKDLFNDNEVMVQQAHLDRRVGNVMWKDPNDYKIWGDLFKSINALTTVGDMELSPQTLKTVDIKGITTVDRTKQTPTLFYALKSKLTNGRDNILGVEQEYSTVISPLGKDLNFYNANISIQSGSDHYTADNARRLINSKLFQIIKESPDLIVENSQMISSIDITHQFSRNLDWISGELEYVDPKHGLKEIKRIAYNGVNYSVSVAIINDRNMGYLYLLNTDTKKIESINIVIIKNSDSFGGSIRHEEQVDFYIDDGSQIHKPLFKHYLASIMKPEKVKAYEYKNTLNGRYIDENTKVDDFTTEVRQLYYPYTQVELFTNSKRVKTLDLSKGNPEGWAILHTYYTPSSLIDKYDIIGWNQEQNLKGHSNNHPSVILDQVNYSVMGSISKWESFIANNRAVKDQTISNTNFAITRQEVSTGVGVLKSGIGGALGGFAVGGPIGAIVGGLAGAVSSGVSGGMAIEGARNQLKMIQAGYTDMKNAPDIITGTTGDVLKDIDWDNHHSLWIKVKRLPEIIEKPFRRMLYYHGQNLNGVLVNINDYLETRYWFNYIQANGVFENIKGKISPDIKQLIDTSLSNGITIWHYDPLNWKGIKNYEYENIETKTYNWKDYTKLML